MYAEAIAEAVERIPIGEAGRSGTRLEKVRLSDGSALVVKRTSAAYDRVTQTTGGHGREPRLFLSGAFRTLPPGVGHAIVEAWAEGDEWVILMRDVSAGLIPGDHVATYGEVERVLTGLSALHRAYASGPRPAPLCPLPLMLGNLYPGKIAAVRADHDFPGLVLRGWQRFHEVVPADISAAVRAVHHDHSGLADRLGRFPSTFLHGDPWLVNCSLMPDEIVFFDWALAAWGPPAIDLSVFLAGHGSRIQPSREEVLVRFRELSGGLHDATATRLALSAGLALMGWNKALDVTEHPDPAKRARERADLDWWISHFDLS
ncbi:MAG: phosphotransferase [Streptosporangiaceae bacterium]|nr:phosphotransferase [Streptosporangiaceae bacterium]